MEVTTAAKTRTYKISYKAYYHELSDWSCDYVRAVGRKDALGRFARRHNIHGADLSDPSKLTWTEGDWYMQVRLVEQVPGRPRTCPHCGGSGEISADRLRKKP